MAFSYLTLSAHAKLWYAVSAERSSYPDRNVQRSWSAHCVDKDEWNKRRGGFLFSVRWLGLRDSGIPRRVVYVKWIWIIVYDVRSREYSRLCFCLETLRMPSGCFTGEWTIVITNPITKIRMSSLQGDFESSPRPWCSNPNLFRFNFI